MRPIKPPVAARRPATTRHHGLDIVDEYAWLRVADWPDAVEDPDELPAPIRHHLDAENAYTDAALADLAPLRALLAAELKGRIAEDDSTVPERLGPWAYFERFVVGAEYPQICRVPSNGTDVQVLLDGNREAAGKPFWSLQDAIPSPDHGLLAYAADPTGSESFTIRIRDLARAKDLADRIDQTTGDIAWSACSRFVFYVRLDSLQRPMQVWRHKIGSQQAQDILVYAETDPSFEVGVGVTQSGAHILIESHTHDASEIRILDASRPETAPRLVAPRAPGHDYVVDDRDALLVITTNSADAPDLRICEAPVADPAPAGWREIVPHRPGRRIVDTVSYAHHLVRLEREDGQLRLVVRRWSDGAEHEIAFDEPAYHLAVEPGLAFDTDIVRFVYSSMRTPRQVFDYDMETRARVLRKTQQLPTGHDPADYVTERAFAVAADGQTIPISLVYRASTPRDGSAPLWLHAYGSYGVPMEAEFDALRLSLVDRGFVTALAHVRGGEDKGQAWYLDGRHRTKLNTFTDYIAVAKHLAATGYTREGRIVAYGESAGGMLVGVAANMAPSLFAAVIADVPFVDVLNTMLDADLPMTPGEWSEWGNPIDSRADFELIRSYSPYENVKRQAYPHILANASLADLRVAYWEPAKWIARLRERNTGEGLMLLRMTMTGGHDGASGRFQQLDKAAFDYAFALKVAGLAA